MEYFKSLDIVYPSWKEHMGSACQKWIKNGTETSQEQELKASDWMWMEVLALSLPTNKCLATTQRLLSSSHLDQGSKCSFFFGCKKIPLRTAKTSRVQHRRQLLQKPPIVESAVVSHNLAHTLCFWLSEWETVWLRHHWEIRTDESR